MFNKNNRTDLRQLAETALEMNIINFRQYSRVLAKLPVNINGFNLGIDELAQYVGKKIVIEAKHNAQKNN